METDFGLARHLGFWLRRVSNRMSAQFARTLAQRDLSLAEWIALSHIVKSRESHPAQIAAATGMSRGGMSKILDKLDEKKWIRRELDARDNRIQRLTLTRRGRLALPELVRIADCNDEHFFGVLDERERVQLRHFLEKLAAAHR